MVYYPRYNITEAVNSSGLGMNTFIAFTNSQVNFIIGFCIILILFTVILIYTRTRGNSFQSSLMASSVVCLLVAILGYPIQLINGKLLVFCVVLFPLTFFLSFILGDE